MQNIQPEGHSLSMLPFAVLLLSIAFAPLVIRHHRERHYHKLCLGLAAITSSYYVIALGSGSRVLHAGFEYGSFMVAVGSVFVVAGGIHLRLGGRARPVRNTLFLLGGALLGNVLGTIGASMLLIRPWIAMNRNRFAGFHLAFFIFTVSNIGGALLPVGPPLFLGYLKGVPFWWTLQRCWAPWAVTLGAVLAVFYVVDSVQFRARGRASSEANIAPLAENWHCDGSINFIFMSAILAALIHPPGGGRRS